MSFDGDLYPTSGATSVMTTKGDIVRYDSQRERYGIGSTNQILQVKSGLPSWETLSTASSVLTTQGDILYQDAAGLARLGQSTDGFVLTTKGAGANPVWAAAGGGGSLELIETKDVVGTSTDTLAFTFSTALDFESDTASMFFTYQGGSDNSTDIRVRLGDTAAGGVLTTSTYDKTQTINSSGTITGSSNTGEANWDVASHAAVDTDNGFAGFGYVSTGYDSSGDSYLFLQQFTNSTVYQTTFSGKNTTTTDGTLKYFNFYMGGQNFMPDSSCTCYKVVRA